VVELVEARRAQLVSEFPGVSVTACPAGVHLGRARRQAARCPGRRRRGRRGRRPALLSIAAGVTIATIQAAVGDVAVLRSMPNTPALVGEGVSALAAGATATDADVEWAEQILRGVGTVVRVGEHQLDAVTGLTGSGPAYLFLVAEALMDAGVVAGLPGATAEAMVAQLLVGSARLLADRGDPRRSAPW
jgi:pyrroline-5-carboxylate reductase